MLHETDSSSPFSEALPADVETILADETSFVRADLATTGSFTVSSRTTVPNVIVRHFLGRDAVAGTRLVRSFRMMDRSSVFSSLLDVELYREG